MGPAIVNISGALYDLCELGIGGHVESQQRGPNRKAEEGPALSVHGFDRPAVLCSASLEYRRCPSIETDHISLGLYPEVMHLKRVRYFLAVAEELHFGRAAEKLHMAQPPLSQQIRLLEADLGAKLFERSTRRVALTAAGELLLGEARRLVVQADNIERMMAEHRSGVRGVLRVGFVDSAAYETLPCFLHSHREQFPEIRYELRSMSVLLVPSTTTKRFG
ncbi:MAG: hypothetical protein ACI91O_000164 [Candidatus Poriferisodalaceae bacterium]|jgi:hypothetical protein